MAAAFLGTGTQIVAVTLAAAPGGVRGRHGAAARHAVQQTLEQSSKAVAGHGSLGLALGVQQVLDLLPEPLGYDGAVLAEVNGAFVLDVAGIKHIGQQLVQAGPGEGPPATLVSLAGDRKSTRLNSSHRSLSRMPSSA